MAVEIKDVGRFGKHRKKTLCENSENLKEKATAAVVNSVCFPAFFEL